MSINVNINETLRDSYLEYSMSVIIGRALPDVRDGLKPVHRRIIYSMSKSEVGARNKFVKSARIVGDVIGKYHPHGDTAVYDALVRMAQDFSMRYPIVKGQGNFGSIDGDNAAAMRYTEAKMSNIADELLANIDEDTVDFIPNYDGRELEPTVLPTKIPNLLLNGSSGIAVGMATNIPPHNLNELIDALVYRINNRSCHISEILKFIKGPDFPTGGEIHGIKGIMDAYTTGRGRIKLRAKTHIEKKGNKELIVIDELPYMTNKAKLHEQIADLVKDKVIDGISETRDESDRDGVRLVIEVKSGVSSDIVLNNLFKVTNMETTYGIILLAVINKTPKVFTLLEMLDAFLEHRYTVTIRKTLYELNKTKSKVHILEGLLIAVNNIDKVIEIIRKSTDVSTAKATLIKEYKLSIEQAEAILDMKLSKLTSMEKDKLNQELIDLKNRIAELDTILTNPAKRDELIKSELIYIRDKYNSPRKTNIIEVYEDISTEDLIPNEPMVITMTHRGYIKRVPASTYEKQNRGGKGKIAVTTYEDDFIENFYTANAHDTIMFISNKGKLYLLKVYKIPECSRTAKGRSIVNLINLDPDEKIMVAMPTTDFDDNKSLIFFTKKGIVKRTNLSEYKHGRSIGVKAIILNDGDELVTAVISDDNIPSKLLIATKYGSCSKFSIDLVRSMGRNTMGVRGIKFKSEDDYVIGGIIIENENDEILTVSEKGIGKRTDASEYRETLARGSKGVIGMKLTDKTSSLIGLVTVDDEMDLMLLTASGKMIRVDMHTIRKAGRNTSGVKIVDKSETIISIAKCPKEEILED